MKIKKALKKLDKVESLLSSVIEQFDTNGQRTLRDALASAKESVILAKKTVDHQAEPKSAKKPAAKATAASQAATEPRGRRKVRAATAG